MHYFEHRTGRALSRREAFEEDGKTIRDGVSIRVKMSATDAAPRFADGRSFWDAHRASLLVGDPRRIGGTAGNRPGYRVLDNDLGRQAIADARAAYIFDLENAYRQPVRDAFGSVPYTGAVEGGQCTVDGRDGRLVRERGVLVCRPIGTDARDWLDKKIKKYNARGQEEGYLEEETEEGDAATVDADKKEDPPKATGRSKCPECDGRGVVHGKYCQGCGGDGWVDDDENNEDEDDDKEQATSDRRMLDVHAVSANHQRTMAKIYQQISDDVSQRWRER